MEDFVAIFREKLIDYFGLNEKSANEC